VIEILSVVVGVVLGGAISGATVWLGAERAQLEERRRWLRDERRESAIGVKSAVSALRSECAARVRSNGEDFTDVNTALAQLELTGSPEVSSLAEPIREQLRSLVRAANSDPGEFFELRDSLDLAMAKLLNAVRSSILEER
jgi:hypothetical protein